MTTETVEVPRRWVEEVVIALRSANVIGKRSCRAGDHLHYANHDRLIDEAVLLAAVSKRREAAA